MEWLFDRRGKSVAQSAQRVVADMHRHLEKQNKKVKELESVITQFNKLFTESLENDLSRLEKRKKELSEEMIAIDTAITERKSRLQSVRNEIHQILEKNERDVLTTRSLNGFSSNNININNLSNLSNKNDNNGHNNGYNNGYNNYNNNNNSNNNNNNNNDNNDFNQDEKGLSIVENKAIILEEQFLEESEILATIKDICKDVLFIIHRSNISDVVIYSPSQIDSEIVKSFKLTNFNNINSKTELTTFENMMIYGSKIVPNHDRDFPHIKELAVPLVINKNHCGVLAQLWGAVEIPLTPDVIIDIWRGTYVLIYIFFNLFIFFFSFHLFFIFIDLL